MHDIPRKGVLLGRYHMTDIIPLIGVPPPPRAGMGNYYIPCPCCDTGKSRHLNISLLKDVFRCPVCDFHGGVFDLYAFYKNIPRSEVYEELKRALEGGTPRPNDRWTASYDDTVEECPLTGIDIRHQTYSAFLAKLQLAEDHQLNLLGRGISTDIIQKNAYKTSPIFGSSTIARQLHSEGHYLRGVPGFYRSKNGEWCFAKTNRGFLIPVRDLQGRIQGLQLRLDKIERRKYRWISSNDRTDGASAKGWIHTAGPVRKKMILIEGGLKADIVHHFTGQSLIAVPGTSALSEMEKVLRKYISLGLESIDSGFDMDYLRNHNVCKAYLKMAGMIQSLGLSFKTLLWDPVYNGLDDYCKHIM